MRDVRGERISDGLQIPFAPFYIRNEIGLPLM